MKWVNIPWYQSAILGASGVLGAFLYRTLMELLKDS